MIPITELPPEVQDFLPIGDVAKTVAKDCIMRAYINGVITIEEASQWIAEMGLRHS